MNMFREIKLTSLTVKDEILTKDFQYLVEASCSADIHVSEHSLEMV
jgi:hypothetical protein